MKPKTEFLKKINKIDKSLARMTRENKREDKDYQNQE